MSECPELKKQLMERLKNFRETVPVFRVRERRLDEIQTEAMEFARRFIRACGGDHERLHLQRRRESSIIHLPDGVKAQVFHQSGAVFAKQPLGPVERTITDTTDKEELTKRTWEAARLLEIERYARRGESLQFERLWQIKATGVTQKGEYGRVALCRVVGSFRRYLNELPVWGRASAFVQLAGDNFIAAAGVDWRPACDDPIDYATTIPPEDAADRIIKQLSSGIPGGVVSVKDYAAEMFSLGYLSLPKRQQQAFLQPVYVAAFQGQGETTLNRMIIIHASDLEYESICRVAQAPPRETVKPQPTATTRDKPDWKPPPPKPC